MAVLNEMLMALEPKRFLKCKKNYGQAYDIAAHLMIQSEVQVKNTIKASNPDSILNNYELILKTEELRFVIFYFKISRIYFFKL